MNQLWFTEKDIRLRWSEVKRFFWEELEHQTRHVQKRFLEEVLKIEREEQLGAGWHRRSGGRRDQGNGFYLRDLVTSLGVISGLMVPRSRRGVYRSQVIERYRRRAPDFDHWVQEAFVLGLSTRRTAQLVKELLGVAVLSPSSVSQLLKTLRCECLEYQRRPLADRYRFLFLDGFCVNIRGAVRRPYTLLFALGITITGEKEILGFVAVPSEKAIHTQAFLEDLRQRGLNGQKLELIVHDGASGLAEAAAWVFPYVPRQHCCVHKLRNLSDRIQDHTHRKALMQEASSIYQAPNLTTAVLRAQSFQEHWATLEPKALRLFMRNLDDTLTFYHSPQRWWPTLKSTNPLERILREVRRRVRLVDSFRDQISCQAIIYGIIKNLRLIPGDAPNTITQES
jgi:transposase-like protein